MNSISHHLLQIEESLIEKLTRQAQATTDPHIKRELLIAASQLVDRALQRLMGNSI